MDQTSFPPQHQPQHPGKESEMNPKPVYDDPNFIGSGKLKDKVAIVTGGDSGIGRAVSVAFAKEGADVAIAYLQENADAAETKAAIEKYGKRCLTIRADLRNEQAALGVASDTISSFSRIDILVNNIAVQIPQNSIADITSEQLDNTFRTNIFSYFYMTKAALPYLKQGAVIINTASITAYQGSADLIDYSTTKGAIVSFTRSLSVSLLKIGIRVNAVAPGPVWTPLIPSSFSPEKIAEFGHSVPVQYAAQPFQLAPTYVYLASDWASYVSGQVIHVNGGVVVDS
ncbi:MAG: SDR family oxidoreductase [Christensenellales bacterium]|jgi:NAD(P)-dependent dehydrogenase (short-subunit alcohol dehydrogenase family)